MEDPLFEIMSPETKEWFARAVVGMIWADGRIDPAEIKYLKGILAVLKDRKLVAAIMDMIKSNQMPQLEKIQVENDQALSILKHLTSISIVDEDFADAEEEFLKNSCDKLNLPRSVADKFIALAKKRVSGKRFPANLVIGERSQEVRCFGFTENSCMIFCNHLVNPMARLTIQINTNPDSPSLGEYFSPITAEAQWCRAVKSGIAKYVVKAVLKSPISLDEGATVVFHLPIEEEVNKTFQPDYNCLLGYYVSCRSCGERDIPFWQLRSRALHAKNNMFGIPVYYKAIGDREFCDYNLYQVSICPSCLFASNQIDYFQRQDKAIGTALFNAQSFAEQWKLKRDQLQKLVGDSKGWLRSQKRDLKQALISYRLAMQTHDLLSSLSEGAEQAVHHRKIVSFLLTQAEILMSHGQRDKAEQLLKQAKKRLELAFQNLEKEAGIRAAHLIIMIDIYFKDYDSIGEYLNYLNNYARNYPISDGSKEAKTLNFALNQTTEAWQQRDKYSCDMLKTFHPN